MFGIGGGELIFIIFIILMLFGSDKVPEMARTMGKAMAQLKNATNDIKNEIQKGAEANGFDQNMLNDFTHSIALEIDKTKSDLLGDTTSSLTDIPSVFTAEIDKSKDDLLTETASQINEVKEKIEDSLGAIKRKK
jgi:sec-independent protein translocase protein TatA